MQRFLNVFSQNKIPQALHQYGYAAIAVNGSISEQLKAYQTYLTTYLKENPISQISQDIMGNECLKLASNNGQSDYMQGKLVMVYKPVMHYDPFYRTLSQLNKQSIVAQHTKSIYNILNEIAIEIYDDLCKSQPEIKRFSQLHSTKTISGQQDSGFFANNQVNSLTIYRYMSLDEYKQHMTASKQDIITYKSCTSHFDSDLLTVILLSNEMDGLELASSYKKGNGLNWEQIQYSFYSNADMIVFGGAALQTISSKRYPAIIHRVQRQSKSRMSIVFKLKANSNEIIFSNPANNPSIKTQIPSPNIPYKDGMTVQQFLDNIGPWNSKQRKNIMFKYSELDELNLYQ